jgi:acyl-CoA thioesterase-1
MSCRFLVLLLFWLPGLAGAGTILVVGDSLSAAYGMSVDQGWAALLQERLAKERLPYEVINASISGDTTAGARARLPQLLERHQPQVVILQLGGNDGLRGLSLEEMRANLSGMIELIRRHGGRVLLVGVHLPPNYGRPYTERFHRIYHELAEQENTALVASLVDEVGVDPELMQADGLHPNARAQRRLLARIWPELQPLLR